MAVFQSGHIQAVTSVSEPYPHGQRISTAILEYDQDIRSAALAPELFNVENRTVVRAYANAEPAKAARGKDGRYVVLELSLRDEEAPMTLTEDEKGRRETPGRETKPQKDSGGPAPGPGKPGGPGPRPGRGGPQLGLCVRAENRVAVRQAAPVTAADGTELPAVNELIASGRAVNRVVDEFRQFRFEDIPYNLFVPKEYDPERRYPLVMFVGDASVRGDDPLIALLQGNGATSFAEETAQAKHECFVLAPQIPQKYEVRSYEGRAGVSVLPEKLVGVLREVQAAYSVDADRIYWTGQSLGCIAGFAMNLIYPELFAASYLVAGQWDGESLLPLARQHLWMINSDGDARAFPGMNAIVRTLEENGAKVAKADLNAKWPAEQLEKAAAEVAAGGAALIYTTFRNQSVVPEGVHPNPGSNHMNTWPVAYSIAAVRDWLFAQHK